MRLTFPPPSLCTDNAAMIAWTGIEMWENGWRSGLDINSLREWAVDSAANDGGVLGADGWTSMQRDPESACYTHKTKLLEFTG